jgi:hypothetical protein
VHAHCFYVNGALTFPELPAGPINPPLWIEVDFDIWLTKQQPTHWLVSEGRNIERDCDFGESCAGFPPGLVPPMPEFEGELKCVQVMSTGEPFGGNSLEGVATIKVTRNNSTDRQSEGDFGAYNAIGIRALLDSPGTGDDLRTLRLDGERYDACPERIILNHFATGADGPALNGSGTVETELTLVPCSQDFELQEPGEVTIQFLVYNEFEQRFSASTTVRCYFNEEITSIDSLTDPDRSVFSFEVLGTDVATAIITPVARPDGTSGGLIGVAERIVSDGSDFGRALMNLHGDVVRGRAEDPPIHMFDEVQMSKPFQ